jgi:four helix bundle protein
MEIYQVRELIVYSLINVKSEVRSRKSEDLFFKSLEEESPNANEIIMEFKFEKLIVWQKAMDFGENINKLSHKFPKDEIYNLSSQIRRAVDSIALNISEGSIGQSNQEFKKFIGYAIRSLAEVVTCLHKANIREYISEQEFLLNYEFAFNLMNMMIAFKNKIK